MKPRYAAPNPVTAEGWQLQTVTGPSRLFGANGLRTGPDDRVYVAQVTGSQISALDLGSGTLEVVSPKGGDIIAPDDVAFGADGTLYATEVMDGRVSARDPAGRTRVLRDDLPCANGITVHDGRLFVGECRDGGRLMELPLDGGEPHVLLENLPSPNAMEVGPDGLLYYPLMTANEIRASTRTAASRSASPPSSVCPTRSSSTRPDTWCRLRWPAARCCVSIPGRATKRCWHS